MNRRRFAFWVGMTLFWVADKTRASAIDTAAAALMDRSNWKLKRNASIPRHIKWEPKQSKTWRWYERTELVGDRWKVTGITTPVNTKTGKPYDGKKKGYLSEDLVPDAAKRQMRKLIAMSNRKPDPERRARDGRPPSKWLRSLNADELRVWLKTIDVPEVGVHEMTFFTHLTRDHSFSAERIEGLSIAEHGKLHSAAHFGY